MIAYLIAFRLTYTTMKTFLQSNARTTSGKIAQQQPWSLIHYTFVIGTNTLIHPSSSNHLMENCRDHYTGPKHSTLFSVSLRKDGDNWVLGSHYNAPLKGTKHVKSHLFVLESNA